MSFSIVLNSTVHFENTNNQTVVYSFDYTNMEEGKYEVAFSYRGKQNHLNGGDLCLVNIDFGSFDRVFRAGSTTANISSFLMGTLHNQYNTSTDGYLYANLNDNQPVYIDAKPRNPFITVTLTDLAGAPFVTNSAQNPADYLMVLSFKKV